MALHGVFIGINRYRDPRISDLRGARWDAMALQALFADSLPGMRAQLLIDEHANLANVRAAMTQTLDNAAENDTVLFSFAGHGSHDRRLVVHDTDVANLAATSVEMTELAESFRRSKARAILCILDCCFSGAAPARVLEESPAARDPTDPSASLRARDECSSPPLLPLNRLGSFPEKGTAC
jgi:helicase